MMEFIKEVIQQFGGRYFGSEEEKKAQYYTKKVLEKYCDTTQIESFKSALEAHFQSLKLFCIIYLISLVVFRYNMGLALILSAINTLLFNGHFVTYRHWLDFLFSKKVSYNVIGDIAPLKEAKTTLIFAGHIDSVREFKWWYKLGQTGIVLSFLAGFLFLIMTLVFTLAYFINGVWVNYAWWGLVITAPILIVYFDMHDKNIVVDGASDNLTGVAITVEMAKFFSANRLQHTHIRCISFGAEEAGLRGAYAYGKTYKEQLLKEKAVLINLDTIKDLEYLSIATQETSTFVYFDEKLIDKMANSFEAEKVAVKKLPLHVGASDASAFGMQNLPALSILGMISTELDPCYHTRLDNLDHLTPEAMEALKRVLIHFAKTWDNEQV